MATIFVDCSYLRKHTFLNTGIQRVVRCFIEHAEFLEKKYGAKVVPVSITHGTFKVLDIADLYAPPSSAHSSGPTLSVKQSIFNYCHNVYVTGRLFFSALCGNNQRIKKFLFAPRNSFGLGAIVDKLIVHPGRFIANTTAGVHAKHPLNRSTKVDPFAIIGPDDTLLLLDSTWYADIWPSIKRFKERGNKVVAVIYDLIPITHPQFCDDYLSVVFKEWFMTSVDYVDGYIAISKTVRNDLKEFMEETLQLTIDKNKFDYFYLGGNFKTPADEREHIREELKEVFQNRPTYLMVSTIEPRKNHTYILDVFDKLWEKGVDVNLLIIGRVGWKVETIITRMHKHTQYNLRLFHWQDINDKELQYCYSHAKALLFPSFIEGFGLPIIESLENNLPVIASDTPIHKEIGGANIKYCDISSPADLTNIISDIEKNGFGCVPVLNEEYKWLNWTESADMLYEKIQKIA